MRNKKVLLMGLAGVLAISLAAGCSKSNNAGSETSISETVSVSDTATVETTNNTDVTDSTETAEQNTESQEEPAYSETPNLDEYCDEIVFPEGMEQIKFSGKEVDRFQSDNYSVYEGKKVILLVDKGIILPEDYGIMLDDFCEEIEKISGLSFNTTRKTFTSNMAKTKAGDLPWADLKSGDKYILQINNTNTEKNSFYPGNFYPGYGVITDCGAHWFEGEIHVWPSDYNRLIEHLCNAILSNYYPYVGDEYEVADTLYFRTIESLEEKYDDFKRMVLNMNFEQFSPEVTAENVEKMWTNDYKNLSSWQEKDTFQKLFVHFMLEKYGADFLPSLVSYNYSDRDMYRSQVADRIKELYGDDIFVKYYEWVMENSPAKAQKVVFSGNAGDVVVADTDCYAEGERCFIYIEAGLTVPGNYVKIADQIVAALEKKMWCSDDPLKYDYNPWGKFYGISNNGKLPIVLNLDEENLGLISYFGSEVCLYDYGMRDGNMNEIEYYTLAHEASHAILNAKAEERKFGKIMVEGSADFYAECALKEAGMQNLFTGGGRFTYSSLNTQTAEKLFEEDFRDVSHANRGAEYSYGYLLSKYLCETFGDEYLTKMNNAIKQSAIKDNGEYGDASDSALRVSIMKRLFGDDVFVKFAEWYELNY